VKEIQLRIKLLEMQVDALLSVLSEFEGDKTQFTQWQKYVAIKELLNHIRGYE